MENEIWKDIEGYEGIYQVSDMGRVKSLDRNANHINGTSYQIKESILDNIVLRNGNVAVDMMVLTNFRRMLVKELVAHAFIPNINNYPDVRNIDKDKFNNNASNLAWFNGVEPFDNEIWRDIEYYKGIYQISDMGRVKRLPRKIWNSVIYYTSKEKIMAFNKKTSRVSNVRVRLTKDGKTKNLRVNMLVLNAFSNPPNFPIIIKNIDGDMFNNRLDNLRWYYGVQNLPNEIWKNIDGYKNYMVSNMGRVKSLARIVIDKNGNKQSLHEKIMKPRNSNGYHRVNIRDNDNKYKGFVIHRLVALVFIPNPENKPVVNHINKDKLNNKLYNLEWVTVRRNVIHALETGEQKNATPVIGINLKTKKKIKFGRISKAVVFLKNNGYPKADGSSITKCCRGDKYSKTAYGHTWEHKNKDKINKEEASKYEFNFTQLYLDLIT